jgi:L-ascorbate metabolism protein UlaG (beta-lactamase superfamily)/quinol monooxygenase YgiN
MTTLTITRIAHASVLIDFDGYRVLTDPWFSEREGYYHGEPYGIPLENLPRLDGVIVSHEHYDHYDMQAFQAYPDKQVPITVIRGTAQPARDVGFTNVIEMDAWETTSCGPITVTALPGKHGVPEITYMLQACGFTVYFGGDTLLIPELGEIPQHFPSIDVALLAINGLQIRELDNMQVVMNPLEAAELCRIIRPRYAVPTHYTFTGGPVTDAQTLKYAGTPEELVLAFQQAMIQKAPETEARVLLPGEPLIVTEADRQDRNGEDEVTGVVIGPNIDRSKLRPMIAILEANPGQADDLRELIIQLTRQVRLEPGCVSFTPYEADRIAGRFYLYEQFADANAFEEHLELDHVKKFRATLPSVSPSGPAALVQLVEIEIP